MHPDQPPVGGPHAPAPSTSAPPHRGTGAIWALSVVAALGLLLSTVAGGVLAGYGLGYVFSLVGSGSTLDVGRGAAVASVEPGRTYQLLVPEGSGMRCRAFEPDGTPVALSTGSSFSLETSAGRWSGRDRLVAPDSGRVVLRCAPVAAGDSVRLVAAPDWSPAAVVGLIALAGLGGLVFLAAGIALVVVLVRRSRARRPPSPPGPHGFGPAPPASAG